MLGLRVDFEWWRFPDYKVENSGAAEDFIRNWTASGSTMGLTDATDICERLIAVGAPDSGLRIRPLDMFPTLYLELAKSEPTLDAHRGFARKYGLLTNEIEESSDQWPRLVKSMRELIAMVSDKGSWPIRDGRYAPQEFVSGFQLRFEPTGVSGDDMALTIVPSSLYSALALQCLSNCAKGAKIRSCKACNEVFEIHGTSGRRSNREFCSDRCRFAFNHRSRGGAK
jgi:hypothetical protein